MFQLKKKSSLLLIVFACIQFSSCKDDQKNIDLVGGTWKGSAKSGDHIIDYTYEFYKNKTGESRANFRRAVKGGESFTYVFIKDKGELAFYYPVRPVDKGEVYDLTVVSEEAIILTGKSGNNKTITLSRPKKK